tara:strand:- start:2707 stop:3339 length:633 start_codon:yes stop_codon:yes gene_type:complete
MTLIKIKSESMNLADNYAFTGTVTGAGGGGLVKISTYSIPANTVEFNINGIFTAEYENYLVLCSALGVQNSNGYVSVRLNKASDNSHITSGYTCTEVVYEGGATGNQRSTWRMTARAGMLYGTAGEQASILAMTIYAPFLTVPTKFSSPVHYRNESNSAWNGGINTGHNTSNESCGGLNFATDTGGSQYFIPSTAASGEASQIVVYGYEK